MTYDDPVPAGGPLAVRSARPSAILTASLALLVAVAQPTLAQGGQGIERRPVEDANFGVASIVPEGWQELSNGVYARGTPPDDLAIVVIQSAPVTIEELWPSLLPQLSLAEVPASTGSLATEELDWQLYRFDVPMGERELTIEVALAEEGGTTYIVMLQSESDEFDVLREEVLVPAIEAFAILAPEPTPDLATLPFDVEEVTFPGGGEGVELAGTLTLPKGPGPHPAIVLMSGSGAQDRDESLRPISTLKPFALIADALTQAGVAVLRYDDRGVGGSTGDYAAATVQDLAADGAAALDYLRTRDEIDPARIGLLGHSEGGLYAAMLTAEDPSIAFVVGMAAPATDGVSLLVDQQAAILRAEGGSEDEVALAREFAVEAMPLARDGDQEGFAAAARDYFSKLWNGLSEEERVIAGDRETFLDRQVQALSGLQSGWARSLLAYDPAPDWAKVSVPVLGLYGGKDVQVVADQNESALRDALEREGGTNLDIVVFPDANHLFQASRTGAVSEYTTLEPSFTPEFLPTLVDWVTEQAGLAEAP
jgi:pimeloyl-ACP methyl ester carboxylesterase